MSQINYLIEILENRLLPTFRNIEEEAEQKSEEEYERLGSLPAREDIDMADLAEQANEAGIIYYQMMDGLRQGLVNMFTATLYHLFEQQKMEFHRKELLHSSEENDEQLINGKIFLERLSEYGVYIKSFTCWQTLEELGLAANTVKHAQGRASIQLHSIRPELFIAPNIRGMPFIGNNISHRVYTPIMGEDLYVSIEDIKKYCNAVERFWNELLDKISE